MKTLETLVLHGSGWLEAHDASGLQGQPRRVLPLQQMQLRLSRAPTDLQLVPQASGRIAMWRSRPAGLRRVIDGDAAPADRIPPAEALFPLQGEVRDPQGQFLARSFSVQAGGGAGLPLRLYRSSAGTAFGSEGGITGRVQTAAGQAIAWALLTLVVTPPLAAPLTYKMQTDAHGEFRLALQRLPLGLAANTVYPARLSALATFGDAALSPDPDTQPAAQIRTAAGADPQWAGTFDFDLAPGRVTALTSPGQGAVVLQPA